MASRSHNRLRQLQGLVTIDAWHDRPGATQMVADLHMYVSFNEARLGGQVNDEVAFRMVLRQAEIRVHQTAPPSFYIDPAEIWRGDDDQTGRVLRRQSATNAVEQGRDGEASLGPTGPKVKGSAKTSASRSKSESIEVETNEPLKGISVSFSRNDPNRPTWILRPTGFRSTHATGEAVLDGQPWPANQQRLLRLTLKPGFQDRQSDILISLACRREDLRFFDIHTRDRNGEFVRISNEAPMRIAIEEYLKSSLIGEGLPVGDMQSMFSIIILGEVVSEPRQADDC